VNAASEPALGRTAAEALDQARRLAELLRPEAAKRDRLASGSEQIVMELQSSGLLVATAPEVLGGSGLPWSVAMKVVRAVAAADNSAAMLLGYHYAVVRSVETAAPNFLPVLADCVRAGGYLAGVVNARDAPLELEPDGDGYRLAGRKTFCTGARVADWLFVSARLGPDNASVLLPAARQGIAANDDWDAFGERASESGSVEFTGVKVKASEVALANSQGTGEGEPWRTLSTPLIQLMFANLYIGAARGALDDAADYVRTTARPWTASGVERATDDPYVLEHFGLLGAQLAAARALADESGAQLDQALVRGPQLSPEERGTAAVAVYGAKLQAARVALEVTQGVFELMGARSTSERYGFDRRWRDVRVHSLHDPLFYKAKEVGAFLLTGALPEPSIYS